MSISWAYISYIFLVYSLANLNNMTGYYNQQKVLTFSFRSGIFSSKHKRSDKKQGKAMSTTIKTAKLSLVRYASMAFAFVFGVMTVASVPAGNVSAAACQAPSTDYGSATAEFTVTSDGTYRAWSRISVPDTTNDSYLLEIDGEQCFVIGDSGSLSPDVWTWIDYQAGDTASKIDVALSAGTHTVKMIGREPDVKLDKLLFVADAGCEPVEFGNNCEVVADTTAPIAEITDPQEGSNVAGQVEITANADDNEGGSGIDRVEFYVNAELKGTDTSAPFAATWDASAETNGGYTLFIRAFDKSGNFSTDSVEVTLQNGTVDDQAPSVPTNVTAEAEAHDSVRVNWDTSTDNVGIAGYLVYRNDSQIADVTLAPGVSEIPTEYVDSNVSAETSYDYKVVAYDEIGNQSQESAVANVTTPAPSTTDTTPPSAPDDVSAEAVSQNQINLAWQASVDDVGVTLYDVYRSEDGGEASKIASVTSASAGDTNLTPDTEYTYYVVARDAAGNTSEQSASVTARTLANSDGNTGGDGNQDGADDTGGDDGSNNDGGSGNDGGNNDGGNTNDGGGSGFGILCGWFGLFCPSGSQDQENGVIEGSVGSIVAVEIRIFVHGSQEIYRTDSDGDYRITGLPAGTYPVIFTHPDYFMNAAWVRVDEGQTTNKDMNMFSRDIQSLINSFWNRNR